MSAQPTIIIEARPDSVAARLRSLWQYRAFLGFLSKEIVMRRARGTLLGFWWVLLRPLMPVVTLIFTFISVALEFLLGIGVALALQGQQRGRRTAVALLLLPWALPSVVTGRMFEWLYHPSAGLLNFLLGGQAINWLGEPMLALPALIVADVWRTMPFVALLCYARVLTIAPDIYEAARVDGAGAVATVRDITLPLLRRVLMIALLFRTLDALRAFDLMFVLTGGGPANTTETLTVYAYRSLFQTLQLGFGAAIGVVVFALVMLVAWGYLRAMAHQEEAAA